MLDKAYRYQTEDSEFYDQLKLIINLFTPGKLLLQAWHVFRTEIEHTV